MISPNRQNRDSQAADIEFIRRHRILTAIIGSAFLVGVCIVVETEAGAQEPAGEASTVTEDDDPIPPPESPEPGG